MFDLLGLELKFSELWSILVEEIINVFHILLLSTFFKSRSGLMNIAFAINLKVWNFNFLKNELSNEEK